MNERKKKKKKHKVNTKALSVKGKIGENKRFLLNMVYEGKAVEEKQTKTDNERAIQTIIAFLLSEKRKIKL